MTPIEIDVTAVKKLLDSETEILLLDCREQSEFDHCKIGGSTLIPMSQIPDRVADLEPFKDKPLIVHCHHGGRSLRVVQWLRENGFLTAQNMTGGIDVWSQKIDKSVPRY